MSITLQQQFAKAAHTFVTEVYEDNDLSNTKYATMAHKLPILIRTVGLAQALAFVESRKESAAQRLLDNIAATAQIPEIKKRQDLAARAHEAELDEYIFLTNRVLSVLLWYKRFVESILKIGLADTANESDAEEATQDDAG